MTAFDHSIRKCRGEDVGEYIPPPIPKFCGERDECEICGSPIPPSHYATWCVDCLEAV